ncbi:MAG: hypothetical protein AAFQ98_16595 [Bacteroidota bacterium]
MGLEKEILHVQQHYKKFIFSGHRGCGKTAELRRIEKKVIAPGTYLPVFVALEDEVNLSQFKGEDFYVLLIIRLIEIIREYNLSVKTRPLQYLSDAILEKNEIVTELKTTLKNEVKGEISAGVNFFEILKSRFSLKAIFSGETRTSEFIRREVNENLLRVIQDMNVYMEQVRKALETEKVAQDLLFIIDGSEKISFEVYQSLFIRGASMIREVAANMIIAVPIDAFYRIMDAPTASYDATITVPMIPLDKPEANTVFKELLGKRIQLDLFFEDEALEYLIKFSGGCVRQLLHLVSESIRITRGQKVGRPHAEKAVDRLGDQKLELLNSEHLKLLREGAFHPGDTLTQELLYSLTLLKYNGPSSIRINPLLEGKI